MSKGPLWQPFATALRPLAEVLAERVPGEEADGFVASRKLGYDDGFAQGKAEGHARGLSIGRDEAESQAAAARAEAADRIATLLRDSTAAIDTWQVEAEDRLGLLATEIARRALADELRMSRESIVAITRVALAEAIGNGQVRLRVNPSDVALVDSEHLGTKRIEIVADPLVASGCVVETEWGEIDATVDGYLDRIELEAA